MCVRGGALSLRLIGVTFAFFLRRSYVLFSFYWHRFQTERVFCVFKLKVIHLYAVISVTFT